MSILDSVIDFSQGAGLVDSSLPLASAMSPVSATDGGVRPTVGAYDSTNGLESIVGKGLSTFSGLAGVWLESLKDTKVASINADASVRRVQELETAANTSIAQSQAGMQRNVTYIIFAAVITFVLIAGLRLLRG